MYVGFLCMSVEHSRDSILDDTNMLQNPSELGWTPSNRSSAANAEYLLNYFDCAKNYRNSNFSIISKARSDYHLIVF